MLRGITGRARGKGTRQRRGHRALSGTFPDRCVQDSSGSISTSRFPRAEERRGNWHRTPCRPGSWRRGGRQDVYRKGGQGLGFRVTLNWRPDMAGLHGGSLFAMVKPGMFVSCWSSCWSSCRGCRWRGSRPEAGPGSAAGRRQDGPVKGKPRRLMQPKVGTLLAAHHEQPASADPGNNARRRCMRASVGGGSESAVMSRRNSIQAISFSVNSGFEGSVAKIGGSQR